MLDFLIALIYGVAFFFLWWKIGVFIAGKSAVAEGDKDTIILFWPLVSAFVVGLVYGIGKLIVLFIEWRG